MAMCEYWDEVKYLIKVVKIPKIPPEWELNNKMSPVWHVSMNFWTLGWSRTEVVDMVQYFKDQDIKVLHQRLKVGGLVFVVFQHFAGALVFDQE